MQANKGIKLLICVTLCAYVKVVESDGKIQIQEVNLVLSKEAEGYDASCHNMTLVCELYLPENQPKNGEPSFKISDVDPSLCTHILFRQTELNATSFATNVNPIGYHENLFEELAQLQNRNPNLQLLISVDGGEGGNASDVAYSAIAENQTKRTAFAESVFQLLKTQKIQGVDVAWRHPGIPENSGSSKDLGNLPLLLKELKSRLQDNYLLTVTFARLLCNFFETQQWSDVLQFVDHIHVEMFDDSGPETDIVYHHASLRSLKTTLQCYAKTVPPEKIIPVLPSHAMTFLPILRTSRTGSSHYVFLVDRPSFRDVCRNFTNQNTTYKYNGESGLDPFVKREQKWFTFDDLNSIQRKVDFIMNMSLKGMGLSSIYNDDYTGLTCGSESEARLKYPLLRTINHRIAQNLGSECPSGATIESKYLIVWVGVGIVAFILCFVIAVVLFKNGILGRKISKIQTML